MTAGEANAAMGLRVQTIILVNCGRKPLTLTGYPGLRLQGSDGARLKLRIDHGARRITTAVHDPGPTTVTLRPRASARFALVWRNTDDGSRDPQAGATITVGSARLTFDSPVDLGTTARLGVTAWEATSTR
ncbi:DUF4232 domain-containing protein [Nonomuraea sp. NBC_01738]|uniref:DUF4232 domain-containing protein n=1 Tax=Nonomuraea sp. NBC_01738 TaxID=2976003 RepID=UPI002E12D625|nr:DUF4232 domain-containing protein [Nonomuraea sp. NBC_01738]